MVVTRNQVSLVALKLQVLEDERKQFHDALDIYVNQVITLGQLFVESEGTQGPNFQEVSQEIEQALMCVMDKRKIYYNQNPCAKQKSEATKYSSSEFTSGSTSSESTSESTHFTADSVLSCIKYYIDNTESLVQSNRSNIEIVSGMIPQIMNEINQLKLQMEAMEEFKLKLSDVDNRVSVIETDDSVNIMKSQITHLETTLPGIESQLSVLNDEFTLYKTETDNNLNSLEQSLVSLNLTQSATDQKVNELNITITNNEEKLHSVDRILRDKSKELEKTNERLQLIEKNTANMKQQTEERIERDQVTIAEIENRLRRQEEKWNDREMKNIRKIEDKLQRIDAERKKDIYFMGENMEKIIAKLDDLKTNENTMSTKLDIIEKRQKRPLGFSAKLSLSFTTPIKKTVLRDFTDIVSNRGDHFQPQTGEFTAPIEGLYVISLMHRQWQDGEIWLVVLYSTASSTSSSKEKSVCETRTDVSRTSSSSVSVIWMNAGDKIWVHVRNVKGTDIWLDAPSNFSCFLIG
ncbi:hypothetical protein Btru_003418 [Bulinus truncatus]|nr:hypothetical protein Btru_003418 [Bulinus truncatus]